MPASRVQFTQGYNYSITITYNISHLSILLYYISQCITRIFSLPEGYKGKYDPYFPPSGNHSDQSESLFYFIPAITPPCLVPLCVLQYYCCCTHSSTTEYTQHRQQTLFTQIQEPDALIDTKQEAISYRSICHVIDAMFIRRISMVDL